jgi:hypothetical protein
MADLSGPGVSVSSARFASTGTAQMQISSGKTGIRLDMASSQQMLFANYKV